MKKQQHRLLVAGFYDEDLGLFNRTLLSSIREGANQSGDDMIREPGELYRDPAIAVDPGFTASCSSTIRASFSAVDHELTRLHPDFWFPMSNAD